MDIGTGVIIWKIIRDAKVPEKILGPTAEYLGNQLKILAERGINNLRNVCIKGQKYIDRTKSNAIKMDNDFFWNTVGHAATISDETVQELLAKILAGEYNQPGTYSMSTLQILKMLGRQELELFESMCSLCVNSDSIPVSVFSIKAKKLLNLLKLSFASFQMLQSLGLFLSNASTTMIEKDPEKKVFEVNYLGEVIQLEPIQEANCFMELPSSYGLSNAGKQILKHLNPKFSQAYYSWLKENYKMQQPSALIKFPYNA